MPSPVGHTLAGICGYFIARKSLPRKKQLPLLVTSVVIANLPDLDIIPGILVGEASIFHRQATHSFIVAVVIGILAGILANYWQINWQIKGKWWGIWVFSIYAIHLLLDMLVVEVSPPRGIMAFWPVSESYFIFPISIFASFLYSDISAIFSFHNLLTILREVVILAPCLGLTWFFSKKLKPGL